MLSINRITIIHYNIKAISHHGKKEGGYAAKYSIFPFTKLTHTLGLLLEKGLCVFLGRQSPQFEYCLQLLSTRSALFLKRRGLRRVINS